MNFIFVNMSDLSAVLAGGMRIIVFAISTLVYKMIITMYDIFDRLCKSRLFEEELLKTFIDRISVILGIVMLFIVIFSFIKMLVDPDKINDKEFGATSIIKKIILVIVMLGMSNFAFSGLYFIQDVVIEDDIISKLLLPVTIDETQSDDFGGVLSEELFSAFYQVDSVVLEKKGDDQEVLLCNSMVKQFREQIVTNGNFALGRECLNKTVEIEKAETFIIDYNYLFSFLVGCVVLYFIFTYCISVGVRMIQLLFLEIISPMAIVSYLIPKKETMFGKWCKIYFSTYIDVFIRIAIIDFVVFIIAAIFKEYDKMSFWSSVGYDGKAIVKVIIVIALLTFAKKAPDLIKELFPGAPSKLGFGMKSPKQIFDGMLGGNVVKAGAKVATVGAAIGAIGAFNSARSRYKMNMKDVDKKDSEKYADARRKALLGATGGALMAFGRGLNAGATAKGNPFKSIGEGLNKQRTFDDKYDQLITSGGDPLGKLGSKITSYYGETKGQEYTRKIKNNQDFVDAYNKIDNLAESFLEVKKAKGLWQNAQARGADDTEIQRLFDKYKEVKREMITRSINKETKFKDIDGVERDMDVKSLALAAQVQVDYEDIKNLINTGRVSLSYKTKEGNPVYINKDNLENIKSADGLDKAAAAASGDIAEIKKTPGYSKAIANDKAAGVDSNATANKK